VNPSRIAGPRTTSQRRMDTGRSTTGFDEQLRVPELRQPPLFVAAPLAASAVPSRSLKTRVVSRSGNRTGTPQKCHQDLTVSWCSLCAAAEAMTPCTRGVSDLGCGRGHDRRRGQISWSLAPRSYSLALSLTWRSLAVGGKRRPCSPQPQITNAHSFEWSDRGFGHRAPSIRSGRSTSSRGGTPRAGSCSPRRSPSVVKWLRLKI